MAMNKKRLSVALSSLLLAVLLLSSVQFFLVVKPVNAANSPILIQADGTIQGTSDIQREGNLYTLTADVQGPLFVKSDYITINGSGHTLQGGNGRGIVLSQRHNVTVEDTRITLDLGYVIDLTGAVGCALIGDTLVGTPQSVPGYTSAPLIGPMGINVLNSQNISVKDCTITNCWTGLSIDKSSGSTIIGNNVVGGGAGFDIQNSAGNVFRDNHLTNCGFSLRTYSTYRYENDLDSSNTVDGKPIYYWVNVEGGTVPSDASYIVLVNCMGVTAANASPRGITLASTTNSTLIGIKGSGISLVNSSGIHILDSVVSGQAIGIELQSSSNNVIEGNEISNCATRGINLDEANDNVISGNMITSNTYAIAPFVSTTSSGNIVTSNNFTLNEFAVWVDGDMRIFGNIFENNTSGAIWLSGGSGSVISQNSFANNGNALYISGSSGNTIYLNNFLKNSVQVADAGVNNSTTQSTEADGDAKDSVQLVSVHSTPVNFVPPPPPSTNSWDNGTMGNYWIDYNGSDVNGDGIGDTACHIYENNQDNYPLMSRVSVSGAENTPFESPTSTPAPPDSFTPSSSSFPDASTTSKPQSGFLGTSLPVEYGYAILAVLVIIVVAGLSLFYLKKLRK
jgi:parallel beta-helix repeat protein